MADGIKKVDAPKIKGMPPPQHKINKKLIGQFAINKDKEYSSESEIDKLINSKLIQSLVGIDLETNFEKAELIEDYGDYRKLKQKYFLKWIVENGLLSEIKEDFKKPKFICFGGVLSDMMKTTEIQNTKWNIYGIKFNDSIYLWEKVESSVPNFQPKGVESYYGVYFEHILAENASPNPNENEKHFVISELTYGTHTMLVLNEIDAQNDKGEFVAIQCQKQCSPRTKSLKLNKLWSQNVICGTNHLVIGYRGDNGILNRVEETNLDAISKNHFWSPGKCYTSLNEVLNWIEIQLKDADFVVKSFRSSLGSLTCSELTEDCREDVLPQWYINEIRKNI